jgi:hypothetical protein
VVLLSERTFGVPVEVGSFLAGLSLSTTWGHFQIMNKIKTLRDVFLTLFFVSLGMQVGFGKINFLMVGYLSIVVILGKFSVTYVWSLLTKVGSRVAFLTAINMTQISEFGLVVAGLGLVSGLWDVDVVRTVTVTGLLTMTVSTLLIGSAEDLFGVAKRRLKKLFEIGVNKDKTRSELRNHIVLLGCDRTGRSILRHLEKNGNPYVVVDFNPDIIGKVKEKGGEVIFADVSDPDIIDLANMKEAKAVVSTIKDKNDSLALLSELKRRKIKVNVIVDAESAKEARELYEAGASYVVFPHFVSGWHVNQLIKKSVNDKHILEKYRVKQEEAMRVVYEGEY